VVEQGTHKPLVGSSNLPPGIVLCLGFTYFADRQADITSARLLILMPGFRNTSVVIHTQLSGLARVSKSLQARRSQH
jgi:hypothetical protein